MDCTEKYFKNKDIEMSYLNEIRELMEMKCEKLFTGAHWNKHGFPLDIIATKNMAHVFQYKS